MLSYSAHAFYVCQMETYPDQVQEIAQHREDGPSEAAPQT